MFKDRTVLETLDVHGYTSSECKYAVLALLERSVRGNSKGVVRVITGKGLHSSTGASQLGVVVKSLCKKYKLVYSYDKISDGGSGVIVIKI